MTKLATQYHSSESSSVKDKQSVIFNRKTHAILIGNIPYVKKKQCLYRQETDAHKKFWNIAALNELGYEESLISF